MKRIFIKGILLTIIFTGINMMNPVFGDGPPPPPPPQNGETGNVPGGGVPIGEGIFILSLLGAAYGSKKWQKSRQGN